MNLQIDLASGWTDGQISVRIDLKQNTTEQGSVEKLCDEHWLRKVLS